MALAYFVIACMCIQLLQCVSFLQTDDNLTLNPYMSSTGFDVPAFNFIGILFQYCLECKLSQKLKSAIPINYDAANILSTNEL